MKWDKIKKKLLRFTIEFLLGYGTIKLVQEGVDLGNHKQLVAYEDIIDDFVDLMKEQGIDDPVEIFDYYNYALWNGYLSDEHTYQYNGARDLFLSNPGLSCITGEGVCLNKADFLASIYEKYGYNSYTVNCYVDIEEGFNIDPIRTNSLFERNVASNKETEILDTLLQVLEPLTVLFGNHAITCVEYEGEFYYLDPTNLAYLQKTDFNTMEIINGEGSFGIRYWTSSYFWNLGVLEIINDSDFDYSELLDNRLVNIDLQKLEQFYIDNSINYKNIDENIKNQLFIYIIVTFVVGIGIDEVLVKLKDKFPAMAEIIGKEKKKQKVKRLKKINLNKEDTDY